MVIVGDELLDGFVADANTPFLCRRLRELGVDVVDAVIVRDEIGLIAEAIRRALQRPRPHVVITAGGVGGTADDVTYEAIAVALSTGVEVVETLAAPVRGIVDWATSRGFEFDDDAREAMMRIATIPSGGRVLPVDTYLAAVAVDVDGGVHEDGGATVVALPGPPGHLARVFDEAVVPRVLEGVGVAPSVVELRHTYPETLLVGALSRLGRRYPDLRIGSYPGETMVVRFQGEASQCEAAAAELRGVLDDLDAHPSAGEITEAWTHQAASWS